MCLGRESLGYPHQCGLAEEVFAALPWPCVVWRCDGGQPVMVNDAFHREFGVSAHRVGPGWIARHLKPEDGADAFVFHEGRARRRRYRMTRQQIDAAPGSFHVVFLMPLPDADTARHETRNAETVPAVRDAMHVAARPEVNLTRRESQVLDGIMLGKLNKVIASELRISPKTVELHRSNLMAKLRVHNVVELARAVLDGPLAQQAERLPASPVDA